MEQAIQSKQIIELRRFDILENTINKLLDMVYSKAEVEIEESNNRDFIVIRVKEKM